MPFRATIEVWGLVNSDYEAVRTAMNGIEQVVHNVNGPWWANDEVVLLGANITVLDSPDPDTGWPRMIGQLVVTARAVS